MHTKIASIFHAALCASSVVCTRVHAQVWDGSGDGTGDAGAIQTGGSSDIRSTLTNILSTVISYVGLAAVIVIVIAGVLLVVGVGTEESRERAQKIVLYTVAGIIVILIASALVQFIANIA